VQVEQSLMTIVRRSSITVSVTADIAVRPVDIQRIHPGMRASVFADFLPYGGPVDATVESVDSLYDPLKEALGVQVSLLEYPESIKNIPLQAPVRVEIYRERDDDDNMVIALFRSVFPRTDAYHRP
jgi:multidrug resistance efflux pump